jgi:phosphomannomutase
MGRRASSPRLFEQLGAQVIVHAADPDGTNINHQCGALFPEQAQELVRRTGADVGFCFDGDADRMIAIDDTGTVRDGDYTLGICTQDLVERGALGTRCIVGTVMSNFGLEELLQRLGIVLLRAPVGINMCLRRCAELAPCLEGTVGAYRLPRACHHRMANHRSAAAARHADQWAAALTPLLRADQISTGVAECPRS